VKLFLDTHTAPRPALASLRWFMAILSAMSKGTQAKIDRFGRIVIPKDVRDDVGLDAGAVLEIEGQDDRIVLTVRREEPDLVREDGVLVFTGEAVGDLEGAVQRQRRLRSERAAVWRSR